MTEYCTVELHGGKLVAQTKTGLCHLYSTDLMPGDTISIPGFKFYKRHEQPALAIVQSIHEDQVTLYIATIRPCSFAPTIISRDFVVGDRLVIWFRYDGSIRVDHTFTKYAIDDAVCLRSLYTSVISREPLYSVSELPLYTQPGITDHTDQFVFTIDPETSVDFDDAISVDVEKGIVYVHIVDIAHLPINKEEERRFREHCLTLYLANENTEHLLDPVHASLSMSLVKDEPRSVITVKMKVEEGMITSYDIYQSQICVKERYHYRQVMIQLENNTARPEMVFLSNLSKTRSKSIQYHLYLPSIRFHVDSDGRADKMDKEEDDLSHQLVATAMIMTNIVISKHLSDHHQLFPHRFHESLHGVRYNESMIRTYQPQVDSFLMVKTYARANYSLDQYGHFGLQVKDYLHFTSPMRRYADVIVHRVLAGERYNQDQLEEEIKWINERGNLVKTIQTLYSTWKIGRFALESTIPSYPIWITGVNRGGVQWYMPYYSMNGFAHVSTLKPKQFWKYDETVPSLQGGLTILKIGNYYEAILLSIDPITFLPRIAIQT